MKVELRLYIVLVHNIYVGIYIVLEIIILLFGIIIISCITRTIIRRHKSYTTKPLTTDWISTTVGIGEMKRGDRGRVGTVKWKNWMYYPAVSVFVYTVLVVD